jgi:hypothetical protein
MKTPLNVLQSASHSRGPSFGHVGMKATVGGRCQACANAFPKQNGAFSVTFAASRLEHLRPPRRIMIDQEPTATSKSPTPRDPPRATRVLRTTTGSGRYRRGS